MPAGSRTLPSSRAVQCISSRGYTYMIHACNKCHRHSRPATDSLCLVGMQPKDEVRPREQLPLFAAKRLPSLADRQLPGLLSSSPDHHHMITWGPSHLQTAAGPCSSHFAEGAGGAGSDERRGEGAGDERLSKGAGDATVPSIHQQEISASAQAASSQLLWTPNNNVGNECERQLVWGQESGICHTISALSLILPGLGLLQPEGPSGCD